MSDTAGGTVDTIVIGVDALSQDVRSRLPEGTTPTIDSVIADGASGRLEAQLPPWTPSTWPSIYTGVNPGTHGVYGFLRFEGYDWEIVDGTDVHEHALWELLSMEGYRSVVVNVPVTHPPVAFDGVLVPGYTAPEDPDCHPDELLEELRETLGEYRLYNTQLSEGATSRERIDGYEELTRMRGAAFRHLVDREAPDFGFVQFQQSDTVLHEFPENTDARRRVYAAIDDEIGRILDECAPTNVVIVSDHGIGPCEGVEFRPNTLFRDRELLETSTDAAKPSWSQLATRTLRNGDGGPSTADDASGGPARSPSTAERAVAAAASVGVTSQRIGAVLETLRLDDAVLRVVPNELVRAGSEHVDFPRSRAYMRDRIEMGVRINLAGREPDGVVEPDAYEEVRSTIIETLSGCESPDGTPVFDAVLPREEVFSGPYVEDAPDVVTVPRSFDVFLSASVLEEPFGTPREAWSHKLHGIVAVSGPGIPATDLHGAHMLDVAPSVLSLVGAPVSDRMEGTALPVIGESDRRAYPAYEDADVVAPDRAPGDEVTERLSTLGYLE